MADFPRFCQIFPDFVKIFQILSNFSRFCQIFPDFVRFFQILSDFCQIFPDFVRFLSNFSRFCQIFVKIFQILSDFCQNLTKICQKYSKLEPGTPRVTELPRTNFEYFVKFFQILSDFCQIFPDFVKFFQIFVKNRQNFRKILVKNRQKTSKLERGGYRQKPPVSVPKLIKTVFFRKILSNFVVLHRSNISAKKMVTFAIFIK